MLQLRKDERTKKRRIYSVSCRTTEVFESEMKVEIREAPRGQLLTSPGVGIRKSAHSSFLWQRFTRFHLSHSSFLSREIQCSTTAIIPIQGEQVMFRIEVRGATG